MWSPEQIAMLEATAIRPSATTTTEGERHAQPTSSVTATKRRAQPTSVKSLPLHRFLNPPPKSPSDVRFVCISDTHCRHAELVLPAGDVLIHCGDFSQTGRLTEIRAFCDWLAAQPHPRKIVIAGNHDLTLHAASYERTSTSWGVESGMADRHAECAEACRLISSIPGCEYLCDSGTVVEGVRVWGSPWQPVYAGAFNLQRGSQLREKWALIPAETDVLLTHGPPLGHGDLTSTRKRAGCGDLLEEVTQRVRPLVHCFGHIHEGYGVTTDGTSTFVNASSCTRRCAVGQEALVFDLPLRRDGEGGSKSERDAADEQAREALITQSEKAAVEAYFSSRAEQARGGEAEEEEEEEEAYLESVRQERLRRRASEQKS